MKKLETLGYYEVYFNKYDARILEGGWEVEWHEPSEGHEGVAGVGGLRGRYGGNSGL